jgi:branched-chain amino acid transport system substrate-binding protein
MVAYKKMVPGAEVVSEAWPKLGTTDFTAHITKTISSSPDLIMSSVWGGDYVAMYKQALRYGMFNNAKFASTIAFGVAPHAIGKDHPEGVIAGVHSNYYFTFPPGNRWPANKAFVEKYFKRWNEYPNFQSDGAYHTLHMYKTAVEKANRLVGGWPDDETVISMLEGMYFPTADAYQFQILDPDRMITIPIRNITAPPNWPKPGNGHDDPTATYNWIKETWPQVT